MVMKLLLGLSDIKLEMVMFFPLSFPLNCTDFGNSIWINRLGGASISSMAHEPFEFESGMMVPETVRVPSGEMMTVPPKVPGENVPKDSPCITKTCNSTGCWAYPLHVKKQQRIHSAAPHR